MKSVKKLRLPAHGMRNAESGMRYSSISLYLFMHTVGSMWNAECESIVAIRTGRNKYRCCI